MLLPKFEYHEPKTVTEACQIMAEYSPRAKVIAGGTDLMVNMKKKLISPEYIVSIGRIGELSAVDAANGTVRIGSCVTVAEIADSEVIFKKISALACGASNLGSPLVRNLATIGGNIGTARPAADLPPSLMCYDAGVVLKSSKGERTVPLNGFFVGPGLTEMQPDEIISEVHIDVPPKGAGCGYINLGIRKAQDCNLVNVASYIELDTDETIKSARIVMGCVGPTHLRAPETEKMLTGEKPSDKLFEKAAENVKTECRPIDDFRGCASYKQAMVGILTQRTLNIALKEARG